MSGNRSGGTDESLADSTGRPRHIVLVDNFFYHAEEGALRVDVSPHLGLMSLATRLEEAGHRVEIFDPKRLFALRGFSSADQGFVEAWAAELCMRGPDVVGFTAYGLSFPFVVQTARAVRRRRPHLPILLGGPHATILAQEILAAFNCFDVIALFECESRIVSLVEAVCASAPLEDIGGLAFRDADGAVLATPLRETLVNMADVPRPALHLYPADTIRQCLPLEAGRGCPFDCTFCSTATFFQRRYRVKPNSALIAEMHWAHERFGSRKFDLNHDLFGLKRETLADFCTRVAGTSYEWSCSMRPDQVDEALGARLTQAGCSGVYLGFETGSQPLQATIRKRLNLAAAERDLAAFLVKGPRVTVSFITGFPEETIADQDATLDMIGRLVRIDPARVLPQLHILTPEPGTELDRSYPTTILDGTGPENMEVPFAEMVGAYPQIFSVFRHFPSPIPRMRVRQASLLVQRILPCLGAPLAVHLVDSVFGGRLSNLFAACLSDTLEPDSDLTSDVLTVFMWRQLQANLTLPWAELVRFRRASALLARRLPRLHLAEALAEVGITPIPDGGGAGIFAYDVLTLSRSLAEGRIPEVEVPRSAISLACRADSSGELWWSAAVHADVT